jgi:hypothetical protein
VNLVSQRSQPTGEGATYLTCAYDPDFHDLSYGQSRYATNIAAEQLRCASINMNAGGLGVSMPHLRFQRCGAAYWLAIMCHLVGLSNASSALVELSGSRRREAKLFPSRGVKLPCLSARSQLFVDVVFGSI